MKALALVALLFAAGRQGEAPHAEGVAIRDLGVGFHARGEIPNLPARLGEARQPPYVGRVDTWMPFQITLENHGPSVEGSIVVSDAFSTGGPKVAFRKHVSLPERARKRVTFPIFHRGAQAARTLTFEDDRGGLIPLGGLRSVPLLPPNTVAATSSVLLVATDSRGNFSHFLRGAREGSLVANRFVIPVPPAELPDRAIEYHGVDALALDDVPLDALGAEQQDAIRQFVARGGTLIVSLLRHADRARDARLADLLPGLPEGLRNVQDLEALRTATGVPCRADAPLAVTTFACAPGAAAWDPGARTIAHRRYERGVVVACGFPISSPFLEEWRGAPRLLEALTDLQPAPAVSLPGALQAAAFRRDVAVALKESMVRTLPPFKAVVLLLLGYGAVLAILPYALFRRVKRLEWSWCGVFLIALSGSAVVYGVGQNYLRSDSAAYRVGVIEGGAERGTHVRHNFWSLFTARADRLDLSFEDPATVPFPLGRELNLRGTSTEETMNVGFDDVRIGAFRTFSQDSSLFETTESVSLPASLKVSVADAGDGAVRVRHGTAFPIKHAWLVSPDAVGEAIQFRGEETVVPAPAVPLAEIEARLHRAGDLLFERASTVLLRFAQARSQDLGRRVLLYAYEGPPSLKNRSFPERGLDYGLLEIDEVAAPPPEARWLVIRTTPAPQGEYDTALYSKEGVEYSMILRDLPENCRVVDLRFSQTRQCDLELYDHSRQAWRSIHALAKAEPFVHRSPLGSAFVTMRMRASGSPGYVGAYGSAAVPPPDVISRIERKSP